MRKIILVVIPLLFLILPSWASTTFKLKHSDIIYVVPPVKELVIPNYNLSLPIGHLSVQPNLSYLLGIQATLTQEVGPILLFGQGISYLSPSTLTMIFTGQAGASIPINSQWGLNVSYDDSGHIQSGLSCSW